MIFKVEDFNPKNDSVLIDPVKEKEEYGQMAMPDSSKKKPMFGVIVAIGPGRFDEKMNVKVGERVCFPQHATVSISLDNKDYYITNAGLLYGGFDEK